MIARTLLLATAVFIATAALATDPLTRDQVGRYVSALEQMVERSQRYDGVPEAEQQARASAMAQEYRGIVEEHGFTLESWRRVGERVFRALGGLAMEGTDMDSKMAEARAEIRNNENMSEARKKQMLKALEQQKQAMSDYTQSPDKAAVAPYRDRLMQITEDE